MENIVSKITASSIIIEVNSMEHIQWTETDRLARIEALEKALVICNNLLDDILENDFASRSYWKSQRSMVEKYLNICQCGAFQEGTVAFNIETKESAFTPYSEPETDDLEPQSNHVVIGMIVFWLLFFLVVFLS